MTENSFEDQDKKMNELLQIPLNEITEDQIKMYLEIDKQVREITAIEILSKGSFLLQDSKYKEILNPIIVELVKNVSEEMLTLQENQELINNDEKLKQLQEEILGSKTTES